MAGVELSTEGLAAFGLSDLVEAPVVAARGAQGFIWRVRTSTGVYAVKQLQPWVDRPPVPFDVGFQLTAAAAGIPLPRPILTDEGSAIVDRLRVYEWVDLAPELPPPVSIDRATEVGDLLGRIHRLGVPPHGEIDPWYLVPPSEERWRQVVDDARARDVASPWIDVVEADIGYLLDLGWRFTVTPTTPVITCHADFLAANVLPSADDDRLVVLDWENAGPLTADAELAGVLVEWTSSSDGEVDLDAARALLAAYGDEIPSIAESSFSAWVVTSLNFLRVLVENLVYEFEGSDPAFADATLPLVAPDRLRAALRAVDVLARACSP